MRNGQVHKTTPGFPVHKTALGESRKSFRPYSRVHSIERLGRFFLPPAKALFAQEHNAMFPARNHAKKT